MLHLVHLTSKLLVSGHLTDDALTLWLSFSSHGRMRHKRCSMSALHSGLALVDRTDSPIPQDTEHWVHAVVSILHLLGTGMEGALYLTVQKDGIVVEFNGSSLVLVRSLTLLVEYKGNAQQRV